MNRRNRSLCGLLLAVTIGAHISTLDYGPFTWILLALQFIAYPQLIYWRALRARDQRRAEMNNLLLDGLFFGIWSAALGFPVWITFISLVTVTVNMTVFRGRSGFFQGLSSMLAGSLLAVAIGGWHFSPATGWPATLLAILAVFLYILVVAENGYARAVKLHETRKQLRVSEQALKRQLDEIGVLQAQLREQANRDPLTGLYNRRYFDATLERELVRCTREQQPLSVVMIDIDHFKHLNDNYGHPAGDAVLKMLASILEGQARASDVACRYGGEEFMLLLPGVPAAIAQQRAEQWREAFAASVVSYDTAQIRSTLSAGIATFPTHGAVAEELIRCADMALYRAKTNGRNCVVVAAEAVALA
ncbi:sensor domain-containing diguanylate cyclase [Lacisediminimonas profundi]|uniref:sensor domain-containing diguanylate cyclase n=1 Tax=Lacisediminimonas profundi TaxID=2603856 RepID=UPI001F4FFFEE|nr:sensor domain-containing diguanylate cyclase [Lacisediminimonas profundi]